MNQEQFLDISKWQNETFGHATALSKMAHLEEEVSELNDELVLASAGFPEEEKVRSEFADCFILLYGAANSHGLTYEDICEAIAAKMKVNKARKWGKPDANGVVNHLKEQGNLYTLEKLEQVAVGVVPEPCIKLQFKVQDKEIYFEAVVYERDGIDLTGVDTGRFKLSELEEVFRKKS